MLSLSKDSLVNCFWENLSFCQFILVFNCDLRSHFQTLTRILFRCGVAKTRVRVTPRVRVRVRVRGRVGVRVRVKVRVRVGVRVRVRLGVRIG